MLQAISLAKKAIGNTYPNPMVGCIITHNNQIIGQGYHQNYGENHAEVNAINSVFNKELLPESTLYVTLEPCSHFGKTPPCVDLILKHKIPNVIVGSQDPNPNVNGKGIEILKKNGINVISNICENECKELNKRFFKFHTMNIPYIILKWAETKNGYLFGKEKTISGENAQILNHQWRKEEHAIMVGKNTLNIDNPQLNARFVDGKNPIRISFADENTQFNNLQFFDGSQETIILTKKIHLNFPNCQTIFLENFSPKNILEKLYQKNIQSVIIEGGTKILESFIKENLFDEIRIFQSKNKIFENGLKAPNKPILNYQIKDIDENDELYYFKK